MAVTTAAAGPCAYREGKDACFYVTSKSVPPTSLVPVGPIKVQVWGSGTFRYQMVHHDRNGSRREAWPSTTGKYSITAAAGLYPFCSSQFPLDGQRMVSPCTYWPSSTWDKHDLLIMRVTFPGGSVADADIAIK